MKERNLYKESLDAWGSNNQIDLLIEEMSELTKSLLKLRRYGNDKDKVDNLYNDVYEEICDVELLLHELKLIFSEEKIEEFKKVKLKRLEKHLDNFYLHEDDYNIELFRSNFKGVLETFEKLYYTFKLDYQNYNDVLLDLDATIDDEKTRFILSINNYTKKITVYTKSKEV